MVTIASLAQIGALVGDQARANMLEALMDGRALTAKELAARAGVAPQTASGHLAKLVAAGLVSMAQEGRHRYHRLASAQIARMLEGMNQVASAGAVPRRKTVTGPRDRAMRTARTCYDHLAGRLAVAVADAMVQRGQIEFDGDGGGVTSDGESFLRRFGIDVGEATRSKRVFCRPCLDWSERRHHLAGAVGAAILRRSLDLGWVRRVEGSRALSITHAGRQGFRKTFGVELSA